MRKRRGPVPLLSRIRRHRGWSLRAFAKRCGISRHRMSVLSSNYDAEPTDEEVAKVSDVLHGPRLTEEERETIAAWIAGALYDPYAVTVIAERIYCETEPLSPADPERTERPPPR